MRRLVLLKDPPIGSPLAVPHPLLLSEICHEASTLRRMLWFVQLYRLLRSERSASVEAMSGDELDFLNRRYDSVHIGCRAVDVLGHGDGKEDRS
jgi:hypothetical protein